MLDLVGNPEDRFSHNEAQIGGNIQVTQRALLAHLTPLRNTCSILFFIRKQVPAIAKYMSHVMRKPAFSLLMQTIKV